MKAKILRRWLLWGSIQLVSSLVLAAIAPWFINSSIPIVGFLIWAGILSLLAASAIDVIRQLWTAALCRQHFVRQFPEERHLSRLEFLGIPPAHLLDRLEQYELAAADPDFQSLDISPLAFVRGGLS